MKQKRIAHYRVVCDIPSSQIHAQLSSEGWFLWWAVSILSGTGLTLDLSPWLLIVLFFQDRWDHHTGILVSAGDHADLIFFVCIVCVPSELTLPLCIILHNFFFFFVPSRYDHWRISPNLQKCCRHSRHRPVGNRW